MFRNSIDTVGYQPIAVGFFLPFDISYSGSGSICECFIKVNLINFYCNCNLEESESECDFSCIGAIEFEWQ